MKIRYSQEPSAPRKMLRWALANGADSSTALSISGLNLPQVAEPDYITQHPDPEDEAPVRVARRGLVALLATRWGMDEMASERRAILSTQSGRTEFLIWPNEIRLDETTGEVVLGTCKILSFDGAYRAQGQGSGYEWDPNLPGWPAEEIVESTLGSFEGPAAMEQYRAARQVAGLFVEDPAN